jgi:hypothetical protein
MPPGRPGGALTAWPGWLSMSPDVPACMPGAVSSSPRTQENPIPARLRTCRDITRAQAGASAGRPAVLFLLSLRHRAPSPVSAGTSTPALTHRDEQSSRAPAQAEQILPAESGRLRSASAIRASPCRSAGYGTGSGSVTRTVRVKAAGLLPVFLPGHPPPAAVVLPSARIGRHLANSRGTNEAVG